MGRKKQVSNAMRRDLNDMAHVNESITIAMKSRMVTVDFTEANIYITSTSNVKNTVLDEETAKKLGYKRPRKRITTTRVCIQVNGEAKRITTDHRDLQWYAEIPGFGERVIHASEVDMYLAHGAKVYHK